jgi:teichuronic acid biosynthesis glycosyltransferase TuaC
MIHILVVSNHWGINDTKTFAGRFVDRQIDYLRKAGVQVSIFDIGVNYSPVSLFQKWQALRKQARCVDIVHARYGTIVAFLCVFSGRPTVITYGGSDLLPGASVSKTRTFVGILLSNLASLFASAIICVSEEMRQALWWRKNSAIVIPDGVDLNIFTPGDQADARQKLGWVEGHPIVIINAARDPENKGLPLAREAMEFVKIAIPSAELRIVQGIQPNDMPLCYRAADVLISASRQEGSPNVIKEALACNLPVVSTPVGDAKERLVGVYPSMVIPRDSRLMGDALITILKKCERSNGREHIMELGLDKIALQVKEIYLSVMGNN